MTEIPEHLRKRAEEARKKAAASSDASEAAAPAAGATDAPAAASGPTSEAASRIPAHLLERSRSAKQRASGGGGDAGAGGGGGGEGSGGGGGVAVAERPGGVAAAAAPTAGVPIGAGPGGHTQRLLTVVKSGSIQEVKASPVDKVHTWPHLLAAEFVASLLCTGFLFIFSAFVNAPLLQLANPNRTPNPSKAPWYFLGLQEMLTMFHPMVAGVTIPGMGLFALMLAPYVDRNPSNKPEDRKFAISIFTIFLMFWAVLVMIGSFFRGPGQNFVFPWRDGLFFDL
jgi:menaquinol-cytochrome c reductase cytochrome b/c subunit